MSGHHPVQPDGAGTPETDFEIQYRALTESVDRLLEGGLGACIAGLHELPTGHRPRGILGAVEIAERKNREHSPSV